MTVQTPTPDKPSPRGGTTAAAPQLLVVDLGKPQSRKRIKQLRKGEGKLMGKIDKILDELVEAGTLDRGVQPVVIVVREENAVTWPFG
jgi:hypothetical protein